jgi:hypothetical protein
LMLFYLPDRAYCSDEIVVVVPEKVERTPVPGAGFSPQAVPEKGGADEKETESIERFMRIRAETKNRQLRV